MPYVNCRLFIKQTGNGRFGEERKGLGSSEASKPACRGFPGGAVVKNLPASAGNTGSSPGLGRSHMLRSN